MGIPLWARLREPGSDAVEPTFLRKDPLQHPGTTNNNGSATGSHGRKKMRKSNIALNVYGLKPEQVLALLRNVHAKMSGNTNFTDPLVKLADMAAKADALEAAIVLATAGSRASRLQRDELVRECRDMLTAQAGYVRGVCLGDAAMLETSGFPLGRGYNPQPAPTPPVDVKVVRVVEAGVLKVQWKSERGARLYNLEMREEGSTEWVRLMSTQLVKHTITGLTSGKEYYFRVQVQTNRGISEMSEIAAQRAA